MRIATHPEAIKHLVKIGMASDISEHIKMVESANESLIKEKDELRSVAEDNKRECEATRIENARLKAEVERLTEVEAEFRVTSEGEKPDQSDKDFKITIGFNSMDEFERDVVSARQLIPEMIALSKEGNWS